MEIIKYLLKKGDMGAERLETHILKNQQVFSFPREAAASFRDNLELFVKFS